MCVPSARRRNVNEVSGGSRDRVSQQKHQRFSDDHMTVYVLRTVCVCVWGWWGQIVLERNKGDISDVRMQGILFSGGMGFYIKLKRTLLHRVLKRTRQSTSSVLCVDVSHLRLSLRRGSHTIEKKTHTKGLRHFGNHFSLPAKLFAVPRSNVFHPRSARILHRARITPLPTIGRVKKRNTLNW